MKEKQRGITIIECLVVAIIVVLAIAAFYKRMYWEQRDKKYQEACAQVDSLLPQLQKTSYPLYFALEDLLNLVKQEESGVTAMNMRPYMLFNFMYPLNRALNVDYGSCLLQWAQIPDPRSSECQTFEIEVQDSSLFEVSKPLEARIDSLGAKWLVLKERWDAAYRIRQNPKLLEE
jgi:hypothetical protein